MRSVGRHEGQEGGQVGELETHERVVQESVETVVEVVTVALERYGSWNGGARQAMDHTVLSFLGQSRPIIKIYSYIYSLLSAVTSSIL